VLDRFAPDVIHVHDLYRLSASIPAIAERRRIPVIMTAHEFFLICPRLVLRTTREELCPGPSLTGCALCAHDMARERYAVTPIETEPVASRHGRAARAFAQRRLAELDLPLARRARFRRAAARVSALLCPSASLLERLAANGIPREKLRVVGYGLPDLGSPRPKTASPHARFAFIGMPARHKGLFVLLDAIERAPHVQLTIYGRMPTDVAKIVEPRIATLPNVRFGGILRDEHKAEAYTEIDALIVPSIWYENQPLTMLEAFAMRTPVVASRLGGMEEALGEGGGWLVPPGDPEALGAMLRRIDGDPEELRVAAREVPTVEPMTVHARKLEAIYREARDARNGGTRAA
jgi:glycosyltransferase involved in cell wall biosynthesis